MKKLFIFTILVALSGALSAQTPNSGEDIRQTDNAIRSLATELAGKLAEQRAETVVVGQFSYMGGNNQFNSYLSNQLSGELLGVRGRSFTIASGAGAQWVVSGETVRLGESIRVYARLVRRADNSLVAQIHVDMEMNRSLRAMFSTSNSSDDSSSSSSSVMADEWEPDSRENPVAFTLGSDLYDMPMSRTIHSDDHDWFVIEPDSAMSMVIQTTGNMDTYMTLYDAESRDQLASNDDGGDGTNAMIRHFVRPGSRYIVEVRGYSSSSTGSYSLTSHTEDMSDATPYQLGRSSNARTVTQWIEEDGNNMFLLTPASNGMMILETTGDLDLVMELLDGETYVSIAEDDDSGEDYNARLVQEVEGGKSYIVRIRAISDDEGEYGFKGYLYSE